MKSIHAETLYTGQTVLDNTYINFEAERIVGVSQSAAGTLCGRYPVVTPAFIDPHSHIGMVRTGEPQSEAEANEHFDSLMLITDALDSVQMDDTAFSAAVEAGVLYSCVVPGSGNIIGGMSAVIRNYASDSTEALVARAGLKAAFGYNPISRKDWKGHRPNTRMGAVAILKKRLEEIIGKNKRAMQDPPVSHEFEITAEEQVLVEVLEKKKRLRVHVHKIDDIATLLRLVDRYQIDVTIEHAMGVDRPEMFHELKQRGIPVTYGPMDSFAYKVELKQESWRNIRHLIDSKVLFGLMSDHPVSPAHQLLYHTRWFLREGFSPQQAIEIITRKNAEILEIDNRLGTLEEGKWASFTCWNGDPFVLSHYPVSAFGEGKRLFGE
jgi:imidazolonepropionase-like amidohydrolase